jgi:hypothetical protein
MLRPMPRLSASSAAVLGLMLAAAAPGAHDADTPAAGGSRVAVPVFHRLVAFTLPAQFHVSFERTSGNVYMREHVPAGETKDDWTHMLSLSGVQGLSYNADATLEAYLRALGRGFQVHCPDTYVALDLGRQAAVKEPSFATVVSCGRVSSGGKAHSESSVILGIKGPDDFYVLQWTEQGRDSSHPLALDAKYWSARLAALGPVRLCPIVPGEAPPYTSCTAAASQ